MTATEQPSIAVLKLTKPELIAACDMYREKAQQAHQEARKARNEALLLRSQLDALRAAYEPPHAHQEN